MIQEQTSAVLSALRTIATERKGLDALEEAIRSTGEGGLGAALSEAVKTISAAPGRVIVTGIGKSGHVARKIAATLASTGEPAFFVHPAEASHGDLGMVQIGDVVLALSWSGETRGTGGDRDLRQTLRHSADRDDRRARAARLAARPTFVLRCRSARGLPERARADHLDHDAARAG